MRKEKGGGEGKVGAKMDPLETRGWENLSVNQIGCGGGRNPIRKGGRPRDLGQREKYYAQEMRGKRGKREWKAI